MTTAEKKTSTKKESKSLMEIIRDSDQPKFKLTPAQRKQLIEELSIATKRAMGKKSRERWADILKE